MGLASAQQLQLEPYQGLQDGHLPSLLPKDSAALTFYQTTKDPLSWDYGTIEEGSIGLRFFQFRNTGTAPLVITNAKTSCGCLTASYPKLPILPNEIGYLKISYHTQRIGYFKKWVQLFTYGKSGQLTTTLQITGTVVAKKR